MKKSYALIALVFVAALLSLAPSCNGVDVVFAQSVPATITAAFDDATFSSDNAVAVKFTLNGTTQRVAASSVTCNAQGNCTAPLVVPAFGGYTWSIIVTNVKITGADTTVEQDSPATTGRPFALNPPAGAASNGRIKQ